MPKMYKYFYSALLSNKSASSYTTKLHGFLILSSSPSDLQMETFEEEVKKDCYRRKRYHALIEQVEITAFGFISEITTISATHLTAITPHELFFRDGKICIPLESTLLDIIENETHLDISRVRSIISCYRVIKETRNQDFAKYLELIQTRQGDSPEALSEKSRLEQLYDLNDAMFSKADMLMSLYNRSSFDFEGNILPSDPSFWVDEENKPLTSFDNVNAQDIINGKYRPANGLSLDNLMTSFTLNTDE